MRGSIFSLLGVASWAGSAFAIPAPEPAALLAKEAKAVCYTAVANVKAAAKLTTTTTTSKVPCTTTVTSIVTIIETPGSSITTTTIVTTKSTTAATDTLTATVTNTNTHSTTSISTTVSTSTETDTATLGTAYTVPASAGFLPVQTTLPDSSYDGAGGNGPLKKAKRENSLLDARAEAKGTAQSVKCLVLENIAASACSRVVIHSRTTIYATPGTSTKTAHSTTTTTVVPYATTTTTTSTDTTTTITSISTSTTVSTTTSTSYTYTTTVYAACASNNVVDVAQGQQISGINPPPPSQYYEPFDQISNIATPYDCCVAGLNDPNGPGSVWQYRVKTQQCFINQAIPGSANDQSAVQWSISYINGDDGIPILAVGNLYGGEINTYNPS